MPEGKRLPDSVRFPLVLGAICVISGGLLGWTYSITKPAIDKGKARKVEEAFRSLVPGFAAFDEKRVKEGIFYLVKDAAGKTIAYAAETSCKGSFNTLEPIRLITVMDVDRKKVLGIKVVASKETPGLGERINARPAPISIAGWLAGAPEKKLVLLPSGEKRVFPVKAVQPGGVTVAGDGGRGRFIAGAKVLDEPLPPSFQAQFSDVPADDKDLNLSKDGGRIDALSGATVSSKAVLRGVRAGVKLIREQAGE